MDCELLPTLLDIYYYYLLLEFFLVSFARVAGLTAPKGIYLGLLYVTVIFGDLSWMLLRAWMVVFVVADRCDFPSLMGPPGINYSGLEAV